MLPRVLLRMQKVAAQNASQVVPSGAAQTAGAAAVQHKMRDRLLRVPLIRQRRRGRSSIKRYGKINPSGEKKDAE